MNSKIQELVTLVDNGEVEATRFALADLLKEKFDRGSNFILANCARRVQAQDKAIQLLHGYVRESSHGKIRKDARPEEIAEYAISLSELGASKEALKLLALVPLADFPMSGLHVALTHIRMWDWSSAEKKLTELLKLPNLDPLVFHSTRVYLGSCILHGQMDLEKAEKHLKKTMELIDETHYGVIQRSARLLRAQALCLQGKWEECERTLLEVKDMAEKKRAPDALAITEKWLAIMGLMRDGMKPIHLKKLAHAREQLVRLHRWERVRGCDYYLALINRDPQLITRLRAGTPYPAFQERLNKMFGQYYLEGKYQWDIPVTKKSNGKAVSLDTKDLKQGQLLQRLLLGLASDYYRPFKLVELHEIVFPGEYFNPDSSILKIHQAISRFRKWVRSENLPVLVLEKNGTYSLAASSPCFLNVPVGEAKDRPSARPIVQEIMAIIKNKFTEEFTAQEAVDVLNIPRRTAVRYLSEALSLGLLKTEGKRRNTKYSIKQ